MERISGIELKECIESVKKLKEANIIHEDEYTLILVRSISYQLVEDVLEVLND